MARKTKQEAEQTRQKLLETAALLFWEQGVSRTSLADIAHAAGVTRGAIYWHFDGKLAIFNAMCGELAPIFEESYQRMRSEVADNAAASLWRHCLDSFGLITGNPTIARILGIIYLRCEYVDEMSSIQADSLVWISEQHQRLLATLEQAHKQGQLQPHTDYKMAAMSLQALRRGLVQLWLSAPQLFLLDSQPQALLLPFFRGTFTGTCWQEHADPKS